MFNIEFDKEKKCFIKPEKGILPDDVFSMYTIHYIRACKELEKILEKENIENKNFIYNSWNNSIVEVNNIVNSDNDNDIMDIVDEKFLSSLKPIIRENKISELPDFYHNEDREGFIVRHIDHFDHSYISFLARQGLPGIAHPGICHVKVAMCAEIEVGTHNLDTTIEEENSFNCFPNMKWVGCIEPKYKLKDYRKLVYLRDSEETAKQTPPKGRSVKQHNLILNFNKKNKRK